ncbi:MAG: hypothetical protein WC778_11510 [Negativicutes bacterium]|jgi:hypothetical protein
MNSNLDNEKSSRTKKTIKIVLVALGTIVVCGFLYAGYWYYQYAQLFKFLETAISEPRTPVPCNGNPASKIEITNPFSVDPTNGEVVPSEFVVAGGDTFVMVKNINSIAVLDLGNTATIRIGHHGQTWKEQDNSIINLNVREEEYYKITLDAGQYWIWIDRGGIEIVSCTPNGVSML